MATRNLENKKMKSKPWFNGISDAAVHRRNLARQQWLNDTSNENLFTSLRTLQREASNIIRCEKRKYIQNIMNSAEQDYRTHRTRDMYSQIN